MFYCTINNPVDRNLGQTCFYEALTQAVLISPYHILTVNQLTIALYIGDDYIFIFDSHQRNSDGLQDDHGAKIWQSWWVNHVYFSCILRKFVWTDTSPFSWERSGWKSLSQNAKIVRVQWNAIENFAIKIKCPLVLMKDLVMKVGFMSIP